MCHCFFICYGGSFVGVFAVGFFWGGFFKHWSLFYHMGLVGVCCFNSVAAVLEACNMSSGED